MGWLAVEKVGLATAGGWKRRGGMEKSRRPARKRGGKVGLAGGQIGGGARKEWRRGWVVKMPWWMAADSDNILQTRR